VEQRSRASNIITSQSADTHLKINFQTRADFGNQSHWRTCLLLSPTTPTAPTPTEWNNHIEQHKATSLSGAPWLSNKHPIADYGEGFAWGYARFWRKVSLLEHLVGPHPLCVTPSVF